MDTLPLESDDLVAFRRQVNVNRVTRPWRLLTAFNGILLLVGYLLLVVVFGPPEQSQFDCNAAVVFALLFIGLSYTTSLIIAYSQRNRKIFLLRSLFRPYLAINLASLLNVLLNIFSRNLFPLSALRVVGIGLPCAFSVIYGLATFLIYREYGPSHGHRAEDGTPLLSEEEMQRRQLLRLLKERNAGAPSPDLIHNTYRLDLDIAGVDSVRKSWERPRMPPAARSWSSTSRTVTQGNFHNL